MDDVTVVGQMNGLIEQYRREFPFRESELASIFQIHFDRLKAEYQEIVSVVGDVRGSEATGFNIFELLGVAHLEARTHSTFLSELFSPTGSHDQGDLFLETFLGYCHEKLQGFPLANLSENIEHWAAYPEYSTEYGRPDIVILNAKSEFLCVIENKIGAGEQPGQLERYLTWMEEHRSLYPHQALIFLTVYGYEAKTAKADKYYKLSYREHIAEWLKATIPKIESKGVQSVVEQYCSVVRRIHA